MKLLVFSDTHNRPQNMLDAIAAEDGADACFFLGDGSGDPEALQEAFPQLPLYAVQGNCDPASFEPYDGLAPFGAVLFFYTHGHTFSVKDGLDLLWWTARRRSADVALFGHTHVPYYEFRNGIHLFNPGSVSMPRFGTPSYGRITITEKVPQFEIVKLEK